MALADFLSVRYVPGPATLFANTSKLLPDHWLLCENGTLHQGCYWDFTFGQSERLPVDEYVRGIREHIDQAVQEPLMADVPLGALLSGGVDSSIITGTMSRLMSERNMETNYSSWPAWNSGSASLLTTRAWNIHRYQ